MENRYPSIFDRVDELNELKSIIEKIKGVEIIEITHNLIAISDGDEEYEYDSLSEAIEEWADVLSRSRAGEGY